MKPTQTHTGNFASFSFSFFCLFDIWNSDEETGLFDPKHQVNVMSWFRSLETLIRNIVLPIE